MLPQQYCLRWKYHHSNLQTMFSQLLDRGCFCDVTLACEGRTIRAHRVVLCACSTYFDQLLTNCGATEKDPIIIMRDAKFEDIKCLIEFMYKGEINVEHGSLASLLKTAEELRIKGLAEVSWRDDDNGSTAGSDASGNNNNNNNNSSLLVKNPASANNNNNNNSIKIVETKKLMAPHHASALAARSSSLTPLTVSSLENRISDSPNLPLLTPLTAGSPRNPANSASPINSYFGSNKKKRGRPPLDEEYDTFQQLPKISHVEGGPGSSTPFTSSSQLVAVMMDDSSNEQIREDQHHQQSSSQHHHPLNAATASYLEQQSRTVPLEAMHEMEFDEDTHIPRKMIPKLERPDTPQDYMSAVGAGSGPKFEYDDQSPPSPNDNSVFLTPQEREEWKDVIKMNDYLTKGRRPQFWEEPFTKRVVDGIKNKTLEMKKAAKLLGVSYGTLYGRYRDVYGCLKHPYRGPAMAVSRMNTMWSAAGANDAGVPTTNDILGMLQRGANETGHPTTNDILGYLQQGKISLMQAAEVLQTTPLTISSYLEQLQEAAAAQPDHEHLAALSAVASMAAEDERQHHKQQHQQSQPPQMSAQLEQQLRIKPEISISALKKSSPPSSSSAPPTSAAAYSTATSSTSISSAIASTSAAVQPTNT